MNEKAKLFDDVFNNRRTETTTMTKTNVATKPLPLDDDSLSDMEAIAATLREASDDTQLIKARLDGITEALAAIASDVKALAARPAAAAAAPAAQAYAAAPAGGAKGHPPGTKQTTAGLVRVITKNLPSPRGGTYPVYQAELSNGWVRDFPKELLLWFQEREGQSITFYEWQKPSTKDPNKKFWTIVDVVS